jgi:hypothetical protein
VLPTRTVPLELADGFAECAAQRDSVPRFLWKLEDDDVDDARVFGGIHFRFDRLAGNRLGREVATYVYKDNLRKVNGPE